ncbi:NADPH-dependent FMN reductase [Wenyingzhuangia sp. IMCC45533]
MKKIVILAATNSKVSINKQLATYAGKKLKEVQLKILDLNDYDLPMYGVDLEKEIGIHPEAVRFNKDIQQADGYIISFAEHNGAYTAVFKNAYDWISRINYKVWGQKPVVLLSTSPGARGGATVLATAKLGFPHMGAKVVGSLSLPSFFDNFKEGSIANNDSEKELILLMNSFQEILNEH